MNTTVVSSAASLTSNGHRSGRTQRGTAAVCCCSRPASRLPPLPTDRSWLSWIWWRRVSCRAPTVELPEDSDSWWSAHPGRWRTITDKNTDMRGSWQCPWCKDAAGTDQSLWCSDYLGATADQSHALDRVGSLSGIWVLQTENCLIEGVWTQVCLPLYRKVLLQIVYGHQAIGHACKHSGHALKRSGTETFVSLDQTIKDISNKNSLCLLEAAKRLVHSWALYDMHSTFAHYIPQ